MRSKFPGNENITEEVLQEPSRTTGDLQLWDVMEMKVGVINNLQ